MGQIFISYCRRDTETVDRIVDSMRAAGLEVWTDRQNIRAGNAWRVQIVQAIDTCDAFVLMLSPNSAASDNVRKEIDLAQDAGRTIFAIMLEPVKLPAEIRYQLAGLQFIDIQMLGFDKAISQLICTIREHIAKLSPVEEQKTCQAEVVIRGIDLKAFGAEKQEQLLNFVAQIANTNQSALTIMNMAVGSGHVFIDMPAGSAYELKTLALNRDKRFKKFGVTALRLAGDSKFINISLGILTATATIGFLHSVWLSTPSLFMPVLGVTLGKVVTISLVLSVATGLALSAPNAIAPLLFPTMTPTLTPTSIPISAPVSKPVRAFTSAQNPEPTLLPTESPTQVVTPLYTATPQDPLVLRDTLCWVGPGPAYEAVGSLRQDTRVELIGHADGWWIVDHPTYHTECWVMGADLQIEPGTDVQSLPFYYPPRMPTHRPQPTSPILPTTAPTKCDTAADPSCPLFSP